MRRVHVRRGILERLDDILGTDYGWNGEGVPDITPWSIQSAMINNVERLCAGISGGSPVGVVLSGLEISGPNVTPGIAVNSDGQLLHLENAIPHYCGSEGYVWVVSEPCVLEGSDGAHQSNFSNKRLPQSIVYDTVCRCVVTTDGNTVPTGGVLLARISGSSVDYSERRCGFGKTGNDRLFYGNVVFTGQSVTIDGTLTVERIIGELTVENLEVSGTFKASGDVMLPGASGRILVGDVQGYSGTETIDGHTLTIVNGIITDVT